MIYDDGWVQIYNGNSLDIMNQLSEESVQCVVTSPPYWGLRKYDGEQDRVWGGDSECVHEWTETHCPTKVGKQGMTETDKWPSVVNESKPNPSNTCSLCGAWCGAFGLEPTPELYVEHTVEFLRAIRRVLRKDGVVFLNLGDSYFGSGKGPTGHNDIGNQSKRQGFSSSPNKYPSQSHFEKHAPSCDIGDREFLNWWECDCVCPCHDGERQDSSQSHISHNDQQFDKELSQPCKIDHDSEHLDYASILADDVPHVVQESNKHASLLMSQENPSVRFCSDCLQYHYSAYHTSKSGTLYHIPELKPKDLCLIPFRVAIATQQDGWWIRSIIIWCLSGGTWVYARTQKGDMPMMLKDLYRLDPKTVKLWNGVKWTQLKGMSKSKRNGNDIEITLRSGERISCTTTHKFPTSRGLLEASDLKKGDILQRIELPQPSVYKYPKHIREDVAWFIGLYLAEGSMSGDTIQIAGNAKEINRWDRLQKIVDDYGGHITRTVNGNKMDIRIYGKILRAILKEFVTGRTAKDKGLSPVVWRYSNHFIANILAGYLEGDAHWDAKNLRWRLGFTRNYNLERDLRTACARLGYHLVLNMGHSDCNGKKFPTFRGELRTGRSNHWNEKDTGEIVAIRKARCRYVYDLGVEDEPHLFALASGIVTHNSKPNPMPESVKDRPTDAHEYIIMMTKDKRYYWDMDAVREPLTYPDRTYNPDTSNHKTKILSTNGNRTTGGLHDGRTNYSNPNGRNLRSIWTFPTTPYPEAHFAVFPPELPRRCILAASKEQDIVIDPFAGSGTVGEVAKSLGRKAILIDASEKYCQLAVKRIQAVTMPMRLD